MLLENTRRELKHFAAVQIHPGEVPKEVLGLLFKAADAEGVSFVGAELVESIKVGGKTFIRFRTDYKGLANHAVDRSVVVTRSDGQFEIRTAGTGHGVVNLSMMLAAPKQPVFYVGTQGQFWKRQFADG